MRLFVESSRLFAADSVENIAFGILAIHPYFKWHSFSLNELQTVPQFISRAFPHGSSRLVCWWLFIRLLALEGLFLFEDLILPGVKVLYQVFIHQLIITMFLFHFFLEEFVLFCRYFRLGMCIDFLYINDALSFIHDSAVFDICS